MTALNDVEMAHCDGMKALKEHESTRERFHQALEF
jgi:hypothetical protein